MTKMFRKVMDKKEGEHRAEHDEKDLAEKVGYPILAQV